MFEPKKKPKRKAWPAPHQTVVLHGSTLKRVKRNSRRRGMTLVEFADKALRYAMEDLDTGAYIIKNKK